MPHPTGHAHAGANLPTLDQITSHGGNFLLALISATEKDQDTADQTQLANAATTEGSISTENEIYTAWNAKLKTLGDAASTADKDDATQAQTAYTSAANLAQAAEGQQQGIVEASQGATSSGAQNLAAKAQLAQSVQSISTAISSCLAQGI